MKTTRTTPGNHSSPSSSTSSHLNSHSADAAPEQPQSSLQNLSPGNNRPGTAGTSNSSSQGRLRGGYQVRWNFVQSFRQVTRMSQYWIIFLIVFYLARMGSGISTITLSQVSAAGPEQCKEPLLAYNVIYMLIITALLPVKVWLKMFPLPPLLITVSEQRRRRAQQQQASSAASGTGTGGEAINLPTFNRSGTTASSNTAAAPAGGHQRTATESSELIQDRDVHIVERFEAILGLFQVFWFFMGMWWVMNAEPCSSTAPYLFYQAMTFVIVDAVQFLSPLVLLILVIFCFPFVIVVLRLIDRLTDGRAWEHLGLVESRMQPASAQVIKKLETEVYHPAQSQITPDSAHCVICLGEYSDGERLKYMPTCRHHYHAQCVDQWLHVNNTCPLCVRKVDDEMKKASDTNV